MRSLHLHTLLNACRGSQEDATDVVFLQVHHDGHRAILKLKQLAGLSVAQSVDARHTVADSKHRAYLVELRATIHLLELLQQHIRDLAWFYLV